MKIYTIQLQQEFNAPIEKVWEDFSSHESFGNIMGQTIVRIVDSADIENINGVGSVREIRLPLFPFEETIIKSEKYNCIEYKISKGTPLSYHNGSMVFKSLPNGKTALDYTIQLGSNISLIAGIISSILKKAIGSSVKKYARRFK
jgi:hypothetical protein